MYQDAHQVILLALDVELGIGLNWMAELDTDDLVTLHDWLEALVVNEENLRKAVQWIGMQIFMAMLTSGQLVMVECSADHSLLQLS